MSNHSSSQLRALAGAVALAALIGCADSPSAPTTPKVNGVDLGLVPKPTLTQGNGVVQLELFQICKVYPAGVNGPAVKVNVAVTGSTTSNFQVTLQPGMPSGCQNIWVNGSSPQDNVTVTEVVPETFTVRSQLITVVRPDLGVIHDDTTKHDATNSASVTGPVGGSQIAGSLVIFTNTPTGEIGDRVWRDANGNGIQDATEVGIGGVTVTLTGPMNKTTTTAANGSYLFSGLGKGTYTVTVTKPNGMVATASHAPGSNANNDSNGSPATVTLIWNNTKDHSIDFGFRVKDKIPEIGWFFKHPGW